MTSETSRSPDCSSPDYDPWRIYSDDETDLTPTRESLGPTDLQENTSFSALHSRGAPPTDASEASRITMTDSLREALLKQEYGRELSTKCELYQLPTDQEEWDRMGESIACLLE